MTRWSNLTNGKRITRGDNWTSHNNEVCPVCGRKYRYFRMPYSREFLYEELKREVLNGDRHHITLRTILGRCFEVKQKAWEVHKLTCGVVPKTSEDVDWLMSLEPYQGHFNDRRSKVKKT